MRSRVKREQPQIIISRPEDGDPGIVDYAKDAQKFFVTKPQRRRGKDCYRSCGCEHGNGADEELRGDQAHHRTLRAKANWRRDRDQDLAEANRDQV